MDFRVSVAVCMWENALRAFSVIAFGLGIARPGRFLGSLSIGKLKGRVCISVHFYDKRIHQISPFPAIGVSELQSMASRRVALRYNALTCWIVQAWFLGLACLAMLGSVVTTRSCRTRAHHVCGRKPLHQRSSAAVRGADDLCVQSTMPKELVAHYDRVGTDDGVVYMSFCIS